MSWLNNMSVPPKSMVTLTARPVPADRKVLCFAHALEHGLPWGRKGVPDTFRADPNTGLPLEPWMVVALLGACRKHYRQGRTARPDIQRADRNVTTEQAVEALEAAARRRNLPRAALLEWVYQEIDTDDICPDLELTMVVLARNTGRAFVASKRPSLEGIGHPRARRLVAPARTLLDGGKP